MSSSSLCTNVAVMGNSSAVGVAFTTSRKEGYPRLSAAQCKNDLKSAYQHQRRYKKSVVAVNTDMDETDIKQRVYVYRVHLTLEIDPIGLTSAALQSYLVR